MPTKINIAIEEPVSAPVVEESESVGPDIFIPWTTGWMAVGQRLRILSSARILLAAALLIATVFMLHGIGRGEFNINIDEAFDATSGIFFADAIRDLPLLHPVHYTYQYYAQYPALGFVHWPPLF